MSVAYGKGLRGKATKLHARVVRQRGVCEHCGTNRGLQCAHIVSRRYAATRCDPGNAFCLCAACHRRFTEHADEWMAFVDATIGREAYDGLKARALAGVKTNDVFWQGWVDRLTPMLEDDA